MARRLPLIVLALAAAACGGSSKAPRTSVPAPRTSVRATSAAPGGLPAAFAWLARPAPASWPMTRIPSGAELVFPPEWHRAHGDAGTATADTLSPAGRILGYLNLTPRQGDEQLSTWPRFRVAHNAEEGDQSVRTLAHAIDLKFAAGRGSCVKDAYLTRTGARYIEIACLVTGSQATSVIVGATPPGDWTGMAGAIEQAIAAVRT